MDNIDINRRIRQLCEVRGWTVYRLAKESGITFSTLCTMLNKSNLPSVPTLLKLCKGFEITLSQFFDYSNSDVVLTVEQTMLLSKLEDLSPNNRAAAEKYIDFLLSEQSHNF